MTRPILFLSDFGLEDEYVGLCHAVIARVTPDARVVDVHHGIPPRDIALAALTLAQAVTYGPEDAVFLAVVDPGVGTPRRAVALESGPAILVGPDNGVLMPAAHALGGIRRAVSVQPGRVVSWSVSNTFHGRDVFAPAAARLAGGGDLADVGGAIDVQSLTEPVLGEPVVERERVATMVIGVDRFGNVRLGARPADLDAAGLPGDDLSLLREGDRVAVRRVATFGALGMEEFGLVVDSAGWLAVVRNGSSAAEALSLRRGDAVDLHRAG